MFRDTNFPSDRQHEEMMERTLKILEDYSNRPQAYQLEAEGRKVSVNHVLALYIVGGICSGLEAVETEQSVQEKLRYWEGEHGEQTQVNHPGRDRATQ